MRRPPKTCTLLMIAAAAWPLDALGGAIVLRSLGTPAAPYGQMGLSLAGRGDTAMGYKMGDPFDAAVDISFRGKAGSSTRSSTFRVE